MDDDEKFRLLFENDWESPGTIQYCYENQRVLRIDGEIEEGELIATPETFVYKRTEPGKGRLMEVCFARKGAENHIIQLMFINNDYNNDGSVVNYGDNSGDSIKGRAIRREDDPDLDQRVL
jgi:hypothetical protein